MRKINFILPALSTKPGGGTKIMYEYANRFAHLGYDVTVIHSIKRPFKKAKTPIWLRYILLRLKKKQTWFVFSPKIKIILAKEISDEYVPKADIVISTWWQMAYAVDSLSENRGRKFNFIQDYEIWTGQKERVYESYLLPLRCIVISKYLSDLVYKISGVMPVLIPNAIDTSIFKIKNPIEQRDPFSIMMLYSEEPRKGSQYGIEALLKLKEKYPLLKVSFFSTFKRPKSLPDWIIFHRQPSNLSELYNNHAIFISPSLGEGWGLPPMEAMACGCAVTCTNIGGHLDFAIENETALLIEPASASQLIKAVTTLIEEPLTRIRIATLASEYVSSEFSWDSSVKKMENILFGNT